MLGVLLKPKSRARKKLEVALAFGSCKSWLWQECVWKLPIWHFSLCRHCLWLNPQRLFLSDSKNPYWAGPVWCSPPCWWPTNGWTRWTQLRRPSPSQTSRWTWFLAIRAGANHHPPRPHIMQSSFSSSQKCRYIESWTCQVGKNCVTRAPVLFL